jgi:hypothetical protein
MKPQKIKLIRHSSPQSLLLIAKAFLVTLIALGFTVCQAQVPVFSSVWSVGSGTNDTAGLPNDLPLSGNNVRGVGLNPVTGNVLYLSTTGGTNNGNNHFTTLDGANAGTFLGQGNGTGVGGGTLNLTQIRVSDDGFVYGCNLSSAPASRFVLYRWPSDSDFETAATIVYDSGAGTSFQWRLGDYMDLRGSGINTEIVVTGNGSAANITTNFTIFKPTDDSATLFTNYSITIPGGTVNRCGGGVTFEGTNNAIYCRQAGVQTVYRVTYNPDTLTATIASTFNMDQSANNGLAYFETNGLKLIATVCAQNGTTTNGILHHGKVLQLSSPSNAVVVLNQSLPQPYQANGNVLGLVDFQAGFAVFSEPNNGISLVKISGFITNTPPALGGAPAGGGIYVEGYSPVTLSVTASGSAPLAYQWHFNTNTPISGATSNSLLLGAADLADAGTYSVIVTNNYGSITSGLATVTVLPAGYSTLATQTWTLAPGSRDYLTTTDTQRGLAYDPVSESLVLVSRSPTNGIHVLSAATGADLGELDISLLLAGTPPGFLALNSVAVADDGAVFAGNLILSGTSDNFAIYRWSDTTNGTPMGVAYLANPGITRLGDTLAARGAGINTELVASFRTGTNIALFTTGDGFNFNFNLIAVTNLPADAVANGFAGLGLAFGPTNTFWAKSSGFNLRLVRYDVAAGTGEVIGTYLTIPGSVAPIGVDNVNNLLAGVAFGQIPQNLSLYDLQAADGPALVDRELYAVNNPNVNGTGAVAFDVAGGRLFSLDSNSGILVLNYAPRLSITPEINGGIVIWTGPGTLQASANVTGTYTNVTGATSPYTNTAASTLFFRVTR